MTQEGSEERGLVAAGEMAVGFVIPASTIRERVAELQEFVREYMNEGEDYGTIPGTAKPTLFKPGAEKLCDVYGLQRLVDVTNRVEDWDDGFFHYEVRADLVSMQTGLTVAQGYGSCNSKESRYRWRTLNRTCPECSKETIIKGKEEYGGGWLCWKKKGGCGATFDDTDDVITSQPVGKIENDDPFTLVNTILKMAKKRALVDAVLSATRSSGLFTQDMEDIVDGQYREVPAPAADGDVPFDAGPPAAPAKKKAKPKTKAQQNKDAATEPVPEDVQKAWNGLWAQANDIFGDAPTAQVHDLFGIPRLEGALKKHALQLARENDAELADVIIGLKMEMVALAKAAAK